MKKGRPNRAAPDHLEES